MQDEGLGNGWATDPVTTVQFWRSGSELVDLVWSGEV
jgi:hypothetical protein